MLDTVQYTFHGNNETTVDAEQIRTCNKRRKK